MLTISPKALHRFQPMDVAVFLPFKNAYNRAMDNWMINHPRHTITIEDISGLAAKAQLSAMIPKNILVGFQQTTTHLRKQTRPMHVPMR